MLQSNFIITTDNTTDLPYEFFARHHLPCLHIDYTLDGICYDGEAVADLPPKLFYDFIRDGGMPITQQANPDKSRRFFKEFLDNGLDVLHIAFSSGLSGTYLSNCLAATELRELYPDRKLVIVDSLCASMGEGLLVSEALRRQQSGMGMDEIAGWLEQNKLKLAHDVVTDDLLHLQRGGRVSKAAAVVGTALGIKPMIHVTNEGKLVPYSKLRGKKTALVAMADRLAAHIDKELTSVIYISHSDCIEDAESLEQLIRSRRTGIDNFLISYIGPTIGVHTGVGTVAVFYFASNRNPN